MPLLSTLLVSWTQPWIECLRERADACTYSQELDERVLHPTTLDQQVQETLFSSPVDRRNENLLEQPIHEKNARPHVVVDISIQLSFEDSKHQTPPSDVSSENRDESADPPGCEQFPLVALARPHPERVERLTRGSAVEVHTGPTERSDRST